MNNVKLLSERERARYYRLTSTDPRSRSDADMEEIAELELKMEREKARREGRVAKKIHREA